MASRLRLSARRRLVGPMRWLLRLLPDWWRRWWLGCALKAPPDAAAVKEQALPALQTPAQWTAAGAGSRRGCPTTGSRSSATISWRRRSPRPSLTTPICGWEPRGSSRRSSTPNLPARSCTPRSIFSRMAAQNGGWLRSFGCRPQRDLGARPLGPRALWPGGERRASRLGARGFRVRATVDCGARGQELVPRHRGGIASRGSTRVHSCERGARPPRRRPSAYRGRRSRGRVRRARQRRDLSRRPPSARAGA